MSKTDPNIAGIGPGHRILRRHRWLQSTIPDVGEGDADLQAARDSVDSALRTRRGGRGDGDPPAAA